MSYPHSSSAQLLIYLYGSSFQKYLIGHPEKINQGDHKAEQTDFVSWGESIEIEGTVNKMKAFI